MDDSGSQPTCRVVVHQFVLIKLHNLNCMKASFHAIHKNTRFYLTLTITTYQGELSHSKTSWVAELGPHQVYQK